MEIEATQIFVKNYRKYSDKARVRNKLRDLKKSIDSSSNWLRDYELITGCAVTKTFRTKLSDGDRMLLSSASFLLLLDLGKHDETYDRWTTGKTKKTIQLERSESLAEIPSSLKEIFN